ncbi:MAG TPA: hypothetical protein H9800_05020 [Candidatus Microbacterium stercoravium]|uniref:Secreted protein n=1 Tax=Candidatus Microbacterium stercoravium TaxID=2838697 RepID=A0A9D2KHU9_9MICO|nr:hypothetical protein [Candidatus Microbacterium stercoravium]
MTNRNRLLAGGSLAAVALLAAGCATDASPDDASAGSAAEAPADVTAGSRIAVSLDGEVGVLDADTLELIETFPSDDFTRVNPVGDGRHVLVTTAEGFQVLDTAAPALTDTVFEADAAGHVVRHADKTVLFSDGWGETTIFDTDALLESDGALPEVRQYESEAPHHGVSIVLADGTLVTTVGTADSRSGAVALEPHDDHYHELAISDQCPEIHGEGTAADEVAVFGCQNGALLFKDGEFLKLDAPDDFGRMGNAYVAEDDPIVVGDYKNDPDDEGYLLNSIALIDTANETYTVQDLGDVEFTWRGAGRGPGGLFFMLGTDGAIHSLDPATGEFTDDEFPIVDPWEGPDDWQTPHPGMITAGDVAYVTDVDGQRLVSVDLTTGDILAEGEELSSLPNEVAVNL